MFGVLIELNWITRLLLNMQIWSYSARHITGQLFKVLLPTSRTRRKPSISLGEFRNLRNNRQPNWLSSLFLQTWSKRQTFKNSLSPPSNRPPFVHPPPKHLRRAPPSNPQSPRLYHRVVVWRCIRRNVFTWVRCPRQVHPLTGVGSRWTWSNGRGPFLEDHPMTDVSG